MVIFEGGAGDIWENFAMMSTSVTSSRSLTLASVFSMSASLDICVVLGKGGGPLRLKGIFRYRLD